MPDPQVPLWRVFMGRCRAGHVRPLPGGFPASFPCREPPREGFTPPFARSKSIPIYFTVFPPILQGFLR